MWAKEKAQSENTFEHKREIQNEIIAEEITLCAHVEDSSTFFLSFSPQYSVFALSTSTCMYNILNGSITNTMVQTYTIDKSVIFQLFVVCTLFDILSM